MVKATWRILALSALLGNVALPAFAQQVIGGSGQPNVEVNWAVLDSLGRQPTLADLLKEDRGAARPAAALKRPGAPQGVVYRPYKAQAEKPAARPVAAKPVPTKPKVTPVALTQDVPVAPRPVQKAEVAKASEPVKAEPKAEVAKADPKPEIVKAEPKPEIVKAEPKAEIIKAEPKAAGPQISLPEIKPVLPKPAPAPVVKAEPVPVPVQLAKVEPPVASPLPASVIAAPALTPVAKVEPASAPQLAALPSTATAIKGDTMSIAFGGEDAKLPGGAQANLLALAKRMEKDESIGLQLLAYAAGDDSGASKARRLSLSRALEVRKFLMEQGVRSTRIEVRALGNKVDGAGPADRVDAVLVSR